MSERLTDEELVAIEARCAAATDGPWFWDSYSQIGAEVEPGHPLDACPDDPKLNVNGKKVAIVAWVEGGPAQRGRGDELHNEEARCNADFIAAARTDVPRLAAELRRLREDNAALREALVGMRAAFRQARNKEQENAIEATSAALAKLSEPTRG